MASPEASSAKDRRQNFVGAVEGAIKAGEEPLQPIGDIEVTFLGRLQDVVVARPLDAYLGRHAVESPRAFLRPCERHVGDGARDAAVTVLEWVNGHKPQVGNRRL